MKNERPYAPSWVDRFQEWLSRLPFPIWLSLIFIYLIAVLSFHSAAWLDGALPAGSLSADLMFNGLWSIVVLIFFFALDRAVNTALDKFSILVPSKKTELASLRYQMTTLPARTALALTILMAVALVFAFYSDPAFIYPGMRSPIAYVLVVPMAIFSYAFAPLLIYQGVRILTLVRRAFYLIREINLFQLQPLYAFSGVSVTSGLFWLLIMNMNLFGNIVLTKATNVSVFLSFIFLAPMILLAFLTFLYPLWGIHRRIQNKKETALQENGKQIEGVHRTLYQHLSRGDHKKSADLEKSLNSLYRMREQIEKIPTWPWNPGTFRNFLSAVFLPLGLWVLQRFLTNFLG